MTQMKILLPANLPEETILQRLRQFLLSNGYYELESKGPLRFTNYPEARLEETPASMQRELSITISGTELQYSYDAATHYGHKEWEALYMDILMQQMRLAIETGKVEILDLAGLEKEAEARLYHPTPAWMKYLKWIPLPVIMILSTELEITDWRLWLALGITSAFAMFFRYYYRRPLGNQKIFPGSKSE